MLALLIHRYASGIFSSRRIERATHRDIAVRHAAANLHPGHDTVATFRGANTAAIEAAFLQVLLAREAGLLRLGTVSVDGTKIDADAADHDPQALPAEPARRDPPGSAEGQARP